MMTGFQLLPWQQQMIDEWADANPHERRLIFAHLGRKNGRSYILAKLMEMEVCEVVLVTPDQPRLPLLGGRQPFDDTLAWAIRAGDV